MDSILTSIKKLLGIAEDYEHFDADIIMHINSVFMILTQIGIGPSEGFSIEDKSSKWTDFIPKESSVNFNAVKTYMHLRVRLLFDTPTGTVLDMCKQQADEIEWRLKVAAETNPSSTGGEFIPVNPSDIDYRSLKNLPSINGEKLVSNYNEKDPTVSVMPSSDVDAVWDEIFKE